MLHKIRGPFSHVREWPPCTPKRTQGALPLDPAIAGRALEELHALRNQVRCTWLRHESLRFVTVLQPRLTIVRRVWRESGGRLLAGAALLRSPLWPSTELQFFYFDTKNVFLMDRNFFFHPHKAFTAFRIRL